MRTQKIILALVASLLLGDGLSYGAENAVWIESDGEAYQSDICTPKEVRERAKRDAELKALEQAVGAFIKSSSLVSNAQLAEDLVYAAVRGKIEQVKIIREGWDEKDRNRYTVKLKALVAPVYPERGNGLSVKLSLSNTALREGDEVSIFYQSDTDGYVYLFSIAADGSVTLLLPNSLQQDNFAAAGKVYEFPPAGGTIRLKALFLPGFGGTVAEERIKIIATRKKEDILPLGFQQGLFKAYDARATGMLSDLVRRLNQIEPMDWTETSAVYRITGKP